jgi:Carboxypeptidase regulatory-like domain
MNSGGNSFVSVLKKFLLVSLIALPCSIPGARSQQLPVSQPAQAAAVPQKPQTPPAAPQPAAEEPGSVSGKIVDQSGANIVAAAVKLTCDKNESSPRETTSDEDGLFAFSRVPPGPFCLTISAPGLTPQEVSGTVRSGEPYVTPVIVLAIPTQVTEVHVGLPPEQLETEQIKEQEKQRVFGVIPNFYVTYLSEPVPLTPKHKFELAWKSASDPVTVAGVAFLAGIDQAGDRWHDYGQGAQGYGKRFGASYADVFAATFVGGAVMPSLLKQDPRYFYKGTGSKRSRLLRAIGSSVICKGDNGHWQPNYSNVAGSFAGAGLEAAYIPASDRRGSGWLVSGALIRLGETSIAGVLQEFVFPKFGHNHLTTSHP